MTREEFKLELQSRGLDWDDQKIDRMLSLYDSGQRLKEEVQTTHPESAEFFGNTTPQGNMYDQIFQGTYGQAQTVSQPERAAIWDLTGNLLWEALDTTTFGALGVADEYIWGEEGLEDALTGGGPEGYAGRVGAGIGGALGFLTPMGLTGRLANWAVAGRTFKAAKGTVGAAKKKSKQQISQYLSKEAGESGSGYKTWLKLGRKEQKQFIKESSDDFIKQAGNISSKTAKEAFEKTYSKNVTASIIKSLDDLNIPSNAKNVRAIRNIVNDAVGLGKNNKVLPIGTLQQRIELLLGKTPMSPFYANMAAHALDEGVKFALVETPMEVFQSIDEEREMDLVGRWKHAFALGNALGLIRLAPGGREWAEGSITKAVWKKLQRTSAEKNPYTNLDVTNPVDRKKLGIYARDFYEKSGNSASILKAFNDKLDDVHIAGDLVDLAKSKKGAIEIQKALNKVYEHAKSEWFPKFFKNAFDDLGTSSLRMAMGSMAFNWETLFMDDIPLEDKVFHTILGAYMTKKGRVVTYKDGNGKWRQWDLTKSQGTSREYNRINDYLNMLELNPKVYYQMQQVGYERQTAKYLLDPERTPDLDKMLKILEKNDLVLENDGVTQAKRKGKNAAAEGEHPIYEEIKNLFDGIISTDGKVLRNIDSLTKKQVKKIEKDLNEQLYDGLDNPSVGITTTKDIDDIVNFAIGKKVAQLKGIHESAVQDIFDFLAPGDRQSHKSADGSLLIVSKIKAGNNVVLKQKNAEIVETYNRMIKVLEHWGYISVNKKGGALLVKDSDFSNKKGKDLSTIVGKYDLQVDKLVFGEAGSPDKSRMATLMKEGWISNLLDTQLSWQGLRTSHKKMQGLSNAAGDIDPGNLWKENSAEVINDFIAQKLKDDNMNLFTELNFAKNVNEHNKQFIYTLYEILKTDMNANISLSQVANKSEPLTNREISDIRHLFSVNGMKGFLNTDPVRAMEFVDSFKSHALTAKIRGSVKRGGDPLNQIDHTVISALLEERLVGGNFQMVDIIGAIGGIENIVGIGTVSNSLTLKGNALIGWRNFSKKLMEKMEPELLDKFEEVSNIEGKSRSAQAIMKDLIKTYKEIIEPYRANERGEGFLNYVGDIAQVEPIQLFSWVHKIGYITKKKQRMTSSELIEQLDKIKDNKEYSDEVQEQLNYLYAVYARGTFSTNRLINDLAAKKLYNHAKNELEIDPNSKLIGEQLTEIIRDSQRDIWSNSDSQAIEANINDYSSPGIHKRSEVEKYHNTTKQNLISRYGLDKDIDFDGKKVDDIISEITRFKEKEKTWEEFSLEERDKALNDIIQVMLNTSGLKFVPRYIGVEKYGVFTDNKYQVYDNSLFRFLDELLGIDKGYGIVDSKITGVDGLFKDTNLDKDGTGYRRVLDHLLNLSSVAIDKDFRPDSDTKKLQYEKLNGKGSLIIKMGDASYGITISKNKLDKVAEYFDKKLEEWEGRSDIPKEILNKLTTIFDRAVEKKPIKELNSKSGEMEITGHEYIWKGGLEKGKDIQTQSQDLQTMVMMSYLDKEMPTYIWDTLSKTQGAGKDIEVMKFLRRVKLITNNSFKQLTSEHVDNTLQIYKDYFSADLKKQSTYKALQEFKKNGGMRILTIQDEKGQASFIDKLDKQIQKEIDANPDLQHQMNNHLLDNVKKEWAKGEDVSDIDSYMAVKPETMDALYALMGGGNHKGLGGIKPIIKRSGNSIIIGKTAFITDPSFKDFFKRNEVDAVLVESAVKINHDTKDIKDNVFTDYESLDQLKLLGQTGKERALIKDYVQTLKPEDIRVQGIVNNNHPSTISHQSLVDLGVDHSKAVYDWLLKSKLEGNGSLSYMTAKSFDVNDPLVGLSYAKFWSTESSVSSQSSYSRWIGFNGLPQTPLFSGTFKNQIKSKYIDNDIMKMKNELGGQSVISPGVNLRYTTFTKDGKVYTYGQMDTPNISGTKDVNLDRLHLIEYNEGGRDRIIKYSDIKDFTNVLSKFYIDPNSKLLDVFNKIKDYNDANKPERYQIASVVRRTPHTRPGSNVIVGIRKILDYEYGNQAKVNSYDVINRLEGDYDIDKVDYWWDTPKSILKEWDKISGEILRVTPELAKNKTSSSNLDILDAASVNQWAMTQAYSGILKGRVIKMQRLLRALESYDGSTDLYNTISKESKTEGEYELSLGKKIGGFTLNVDIGGDWGTGKIYIDPVKLKKSKELLAEDIQRVTDSLTGYNDKIYNDNWYDNFLFGSKEREGGRYSGIFGKSFKTKEFKNEYTPNKELDFKPNEAERAIIKAALKPHNDMLTLGSGIFETGKRESVRYDDIISTMKQYDGDLGNLNRTVYFRLQRNKKIPTDQRDQIDAIFLKDPGKDKNRTGKGNFRNVFGEFGTNMRPGFLNGSTEFSNLLPFDKALAKIVANDKTSMDVPGKMFGEQLETYHQFYERSFYHKDFHKTASKFIEEIVASDKQFGYSNYLHLLIKQQNNARRNALANKHQKLADYITEDISRLKEQKDALEKQLIGADQEWSRKFRKSAVLNMKWEILKERGTKLPGDWNLHAKGPDKSFANFRAKKTWLNSTEGYRQLESYIKSKGVIRFKGVNNVDQLELLIWDNILKKYDDMYISDNLGLDYNKDFELDISDFNKFYSQTWKGKLGGADWYLDKNRVNALIEDRLLNSYVKWEDSHGAGNLFLWKVMAPKRSKHVFTYFNERISPAFDNHSLAKVKLGLKVINNAPENIMSEFQKDMIFSNLSQWHSNSFRAHYGRPGDMSTVESMMMSDVGRWRNNIFNSSPLLDDIARYETDIQTTELNPQIRALFGHDNRSVAYTMAHMPLNPSAVKDLINASWWAYMPTAYIPANMSISKYPSINGWRNYQTAALGDALVMLGHSGNQKLFYKRPNVTHQQPFENLGGSDKGSTGGTSILKNIQTKSGC